MKIRVKFENKFVNVKVLDYKCKMRKCFIIGKYTHHSSTGFSGCSFWTDNNYSCLTRDNHGCPDNKD